MATDIVSTAIPSLTGDAGSFQPAVSADGRYIAFRSDASNLVAGDTNANYDIFVKDRISGTITRVSTASDGTQANGPSNSPSISADGRYVVFSSTANNLAAGDTNTTDDVFMKDLQTGVTTRISVAGVVQSNNISDSPVISADGNFVAFRSLASNLVAGDSNNGPDIFRKDLSTGVITRVNVSSAGAQANNVSLEPSISGNGRFVTFRSAANNLVLGDSNFVDDIFLRDTLTNTTTRLSTDSAGTQVTAGSDSAVISTDGAFVTFRSSANNLVAGDTNGISDIFVREIATNIVTRVSTNSGGVQTGNSASTLPAISADGRYVSFTSVSTNLIAGDTNGASDIFVKDRITGDTTRVSTDSAGLASNRPSEAAAISADGRYIAFGSLATNLSSTDTNAAQDIFLKDRTGGTTVVISGPPMNSATGNDYSQFPSVSGDGRYVAFQSFSSNLTANDTNGAWDIFVRDLANGATNRVSTTAAGAQATGNSGAPQITADGRYVLFESTAMNLVAVDNNGGVSDIFLKDTQTGAISIVSTSSAGVQADGESRDPRISPDGRYVTFSSRATNLVAGDTNSAWDVFIKDLTTGVTSRVSTTSGGVEGNGDSRYASVSADGRYVVWHSVASNLIGVTDTNGFADIFLKDRDTGTTTRVSTGTTAVQSDGDAQAYPVISGDGRWIAFASAATNMVPNDNNLSIDVFLKERISSVTSLVNANGGGTTSFGKSDRPAISHDGRYIAFTSFASDLVASDTNNNDDIFLKDRISGTMTLVSTDSSGVQGNSGSYNPAISANGVYIAYSSYASNLSSGDRRTNEDVFRYSSGVAATLTANLFGGALTITDIDGGKNNDITVSLANGGADLVITDANERFAFAPAGGALSNGDRTLTLPYASVTAGMLFNVAGGSDSLTLDLVSGDVIPAGNVTFNGGDPTGGLSDRLILSGGSQGYAQYNYSSTEAGLITLENFGGVIFSGTESISNTGTNTDVYLQLPSGAANAATLADDGTTGNGILRLNIPTVTQTDFRNPTNGLTVLRGQAGDTFTPGILTDLTSSLTIGSATNAFGGVTWNTSWAPAAGRNFTAFAGTFTTTAGGAVTLSSGGSLALWADAISLDPASTLTSAGPATIAPFTNGQAIQVGAADSSGVLGLTDAELDRVFAGTLNIGSSAAGLLTVVADLTRATATNMRLTSAADIVISGGQVSTGGTLLLETPAAVRPTRSGVDVTASMLSFNGDLALTINGATADSQYDRLNVAGQINLTGADLLITGSHLPSAGQVFTIVVNDGNDPILGVFNGLPEGASIPNFLGGTLAAEISYVGGVGSNDVTLTIVTIPETRIELVSGNLIVTDINGGTSNDTITVVRSGSVVRITDPNHALQAISGTQVDPFTVEVPYASITGNLQFETLAGDDTLTIDLSGGNPLPVGGIAFHGGAPTSGSGDRLFVTGGSQGAVTYSPTDASSGSITLQNFGTVNYTGTESIVNSGAATNVTLQLPTGSANGATIGDDGANGNSLSRLSGPTVTRTDFANPSGVLTVVRGQAGDTLSVNSLPDLSAGLTIGSAAAALGGVTLNGVWSPAAGKNLSLFTNAFTATSTAATTLTGAGAISLTADGIAIDPAASFSAATATIVPLTAGQAIQLGAADAAGVLGLTDVELDRVTAATLQIGSATSGPITLTADISYSPSTSVTLTSGGDITLAGGGIFVSGTLLFNTAGVVKPAVGGVDVSATGGLTVNGDLAIAINGTAFDTQHDQLNVIGGAVNITGVDLVLSGTHTPAAGQTFVIVNKGGSVPVTGVFNGLPEGAAIPNFLGSGYRAIITYVGGSGNDVVLTVDYTGETIVDFVGGSVVVTDVRGGTTDDTIVLSRNGANVRIFDPNHTLQALAGTQVNANTVEIPFASISGNLQFVTLGGNDSLTVDFAGGDPIPNGGAAFDGGSENDQLNFTGGAQGSATFTFTGAAAGNVALENFGTTTIVGVENVANSGATTDVVLQLPTATANAATLADDGVAANGLTRLSGVSVPRTDFASPAGGVSVVRGHSGDALSVGVLTDLTAGLTIGSIASPLSTVTLGGAYAPAASKTLNISANTVAATATGSVTLTGALTLNADAIAVDPAASLSTSTVVTLQPLTAGQAIQLGAADAAGILGLTDAELDRVSAATLQIGSAASGAITVTADITRPAATNVTLTSGGDITFSGGQFNTAGGTLLLATATSVNPTHAGADVTTSSLTINGNLALALNGTTVDTQYRQLNVVGQVNLTGVDLILSGSLTPATGQTLTLVANDGVDPIVGTFNGLAEGAEISNFLGSAYRAIISYIGGVGGNDVTLTIDYSGETTVELVGGNVIVTDVRGGTTNDTLILSRNGANVRITDPNQTLQALAGTQINANTVEIPFASVTGNIQFATLAGSDSLTIDLASGDAIPAGGVAFDGGAASDQLSITGGAQGTATFTFTGPSAGDVALANFGTTTIAGVENVTNSGAMGDVVLQLPVATPNAATLADDGAAANGLTRLSGATIPQTDFANPSGGVTVLRGQAGDTLAIGALTDLTAALTVGSLAAPLSNVTLNGAYSPALGKNLTIFANSVTATATGAVTLTGGGVLSLSADSIAIDPAATLASAATATLVPLTAGQQIQLGAADSVGVLGLTDAELDRVTAATLQIGSATSGALTVAADLTRPAATAIHLVTGGDLLIAGGRIDTAGGTLLLDTAGAVKPTHSGVDVTTSAVAFSGDLALAINGLTVDSQYDQLNVAGQVNLTGVDLTLTGGHAPAAGETFTIVNNDGSDPIVGTFNGLAEGAQISSFLGSPLRAVISYVGGDGNDVTLTTLAPIETSVELAGGNLVITDVNGGNSHDTLTLSRVGANLRITDPSRSLSVLGGSQIDAFTVEVPYASVTGIVQFVTLDGNDTLVIDLAGGNPFPAGGVWFDGGAGTSDQLNITGGVQGLATYAFTSAVGGGVILENFGSTTITAAEGISNTGAASDVNLLLPGGAANTVTIADDGITGNMLSRITGSLPRTDFANPTGGVTVVRGNAGDTLTIATAPDLTAALTVGSATFALSGVTIGGTITPAVNKNATVFATNLAITATGAVTLTGTGALSLAADAIAIDPAATLSTAAAATLTTLTTGRSIQLGAAEAAGFLGLTDAELDRVSAATLQLGSSASGGLTVAADITRSAATSVRLTSGGDITIAGGQIDTAGGTLLFETAGAVKPTHSGIDITASGIAFNGDLALVVNGPAVDTGYDQLNVAGQINLTGVDLTVSGSYAPAINQTFTIVANDGVDPIVGTFNGLAEGAEIANFLGSTVSAKISYVGGDGNDVTLTTTVMLTGDTLIELTGGDLIVTDINGGNSNDTLVVTRNGANIRITDAAHTVQTLFGTQVDANTAEIPLSSVTGVLRFRTLAGDDSLTIDFANGNPIPTAGLEFDGGANTDLLNFVGGSQGLVTFNLAGAANGEVTMANYGAVAFLAVESVDAGGSATDVVLQLPVGGVNVVTLGDDGVGGNLQSRLSGGSIPQVDFAAPTGGVTLATGQAADSLSVESLPDLTSSLSLGSIAAPFGGVTFSGAWTPSADRNLNVAAGVFTASSAAAVTLSGGGNLTINANAMTIQSSAALTTAATATLSALSAGQVIQLGAADASGVLGLTDAELDRVFAPTLQLGSATSGVLTIEADISRTTSTNVNLTSGADIILTLGGINTAGGTLLVAPAGVFRPNRHGVDVTASALGFNGDLGITINGTAVDTQFSQLNLAGEINLTGADLIVTGSHPPVIGQTFVIVNNDGVDPVVGTFNGVPEGASLINFLGTPLAATVSYVGGDGNDVTLTVTAPPPPETKVEMIGGDLDVMDINGGFSDDTLIITRNGDYIRITDPVRIVEAVSGVQINAHTVDVLYSSVSGKLRVRTLSGSDTLTIDFSGGSPIPSGGVEFDAGANQDQFRIVGDGQGLVTYNIANAANGNVTFATYGTANFLSLENVRNDGAADEAVVRLPTSSPNAITLRDDGTTGNLLTRLTGSTIPRIDTASPTGGLTVLRGQAGDTIDVQSLPDLASDLTLGSSSEPLGSVSLNGAWSPGPDHRLAVFASSLNATSAASMTFTGTGELRLNADAIAVDPAATFTTSAIAALAPVTAGRQLSLGGVDGSALGLTDAELDRISAATLQLGSATSGAVTVAAEITRAAVTDIRLVSGGDVVVAGGLVNANGGALLFDTAAAVKPTKSGTDVAASVVSFIGDLALTIDGTTPDTQYGRLDVAGQIDLTGADLILTGAHTPSENQVFTIVVNDGSDPIVGTFNGLPEGAAIPNILGSALFGFITYVGGDGNDVMLITASSAPPDTMVQLVGADLFVSDISGGTSDDTLLVTRSGGNIRINDPVRTLLAVSGTQVDAHTVEFPYSSLAGGLRFNTLGGNDTITLELSAGNPIPLGGVVVNGGVGASDQLFLNGGAQGLVTYSLTAADAGSITLANFGPVTFTAIENIGNNGSTSDVAVQLPVGGTNAVTLGDDGVAGNLLARLSGSIPRVDFAVPTGGVTITAGQATDTITVHALPDVTSSLTLGSVAAPFGGVTLGGVWSPDAGKPLNVVSGSFTATATAAITLSGGGNLSVTADAVTIQSSATLTTAATATFAPLTAGQQIQLGGADAGGTLGLTDAELDTVSAATLQLGSATSGAIAVAADITRSAATNMVLTSGGEIVLANGRVNTAGGTFQLNTPTAVKPTHSGVDVTASTLTLNGDLSLAIDGATVDSQYHQLNVAGQVNLNGVDLLLTGTYAPAPGETFILVANDGADPIVGTFNGLAEGAQVTVNGVPKQLTYVGGDGNDVELLSFALSTQIVTSFTPLTTGARFTLNLPAVVSDLNLYDYRNTSGVSVLGAPDVTLVGAVNGTIRGSLRIEPGAAGFVFAATNGVLPPDTYTLTVRSATNGFHTAADELLDGNVDGTPGGNFVTTFVVSPPAADTVTVQIPNFARGPEQPVNVPATPALGLPITTTSTDEISSLTFELHFDAGLLNVTGVTLPASAPGGSSAALTTLGAGHVRVVLTFGSPLAAGLQTVAYLQAAVPSSAATRYGERGLLDLSQIQALNELAQPLAALDSDGVHVNTYFGDTGRNGRYDSFDVQQASRLALRQDTGFQNHPLLDPTIVADFNNNGRIDSFDVQRISQLALRRPVNEVPPLPIPLPPVTNTGNFVEEEPSKESSGGAPAASLFHNDQPTFRSDVDASGTVDAQDVLWTLHYYNASNEGRIPTNLPFLMVDINADGLVDPADILTAISDIKATQSQAGEGESLVTDAADDELDSLAALLAFDAVTARKKKS